MPVFSMSCGSVSTKPAAAAREQHREQLGEVAGDVGERRLEDRHDLFVDRLDHARQLAARVLHVVELLLQELVALDERLVLASARAGSPDP